MELHLRMVRRKEAERSGFAILEQEHQKMLAIVIAAWQEEVITHPSWSQRVNKHL